MKSVKYIDCNKKEYKNNAFQIIWKMWGKVRN